MATAMALDTQGIIAVIQITALILLTIGVYPYRIRTKNRNLIMHGFLSIIALALNLATIFYMMLPTFVFGFADFGELTIMQSVIVLLHAGVGAAAIALGIAIIASWVTHPLGELSCSKTWKLMIPTFAIWTFALILGLIISVFEII